MVTRSDAEKHSFPEPNPFADADEDVASVGYRYRKWDIGDGIKVVARTEHDAVYKDKGTAAPPANLEDTGLIRCAFTEGKTRFMNIKALNNWKFDPAMDWRQKLDTQRGAVLATELKNNAYVSEVETGFTVLSTNTVIATGINWPNGPSAPCSRAQVSCDLVMLRELPPWTTSITL